VLGGLPDSYPALLVSNEEAVPLGGHNVALQEHPLPIRKVLILDLEKRIANCGPVGLQVF
jgi:hypothetical protein